MRTKQRRTGVTLVNSGDGKGKSSSAFGVVFRAAGWEMNVCVIQFIKGKWRTGEQRAAERFDNIEWHTLGDGFTWDTKNHQQNINTSREIWDFSREKITSHEFDLVLLDEINYCCSYGWIKGQEVADFIREHKPAWMHLILTGRGAPKAVIDIADTATEMRIIKHAFKSGIEAQQGIEF